MAETFSRFDAADYLETAEDVAEYLKAAAEDGDPAAIVTALGTVARARKRNMSKLAREVGMTEEGLCEALSHGGNPSFATVAKVARALGLELSLKPDTQTPEPSLR